MATRESRPPSFSTGCRSARDDWMRRHDAEQDAGDAEIAAVNASTRPSIAMSCTRGIFSGSSATRPRVSAYASADAGGAAERRQHHRLGEQLPDDAAASRAEDDADRQLLLPRLRSREQQVGHVGARDEQHRADGEQQHHQRRPHVAEHLGRRRHQREAELAVVVVRVLLQEARGDRVDLGLRLRERRAGPQASERVQPVIAALLRVVRPERQRHPDLRERPARVVERQPQRRRQDADDGVGLGVELDRASDDRRIRSELRSPQPFGQHHDVRVARLILVRREHAPGDRLRAERGEDRRLHLRGDARAADRRRRSG